MMACEYLWNEEQEVSLLTPILFRSSIPCNRGLIIHEDETGNFILRGANSGNACNQFTHYQVVANLNAALPEGADVVPIAIAISVNGEPRYVSRAIFTPAEAEEYGNLTSTAIIKVPRCCCFNLAVEPVPATTDPEVTPAPVITVQNANLTIARIA